VPSFVPNLRLRTPQIYAVVVLLILLDRVDSPTEWAGDFPVFAELAV
jgi:hypothetical protein